MEHFPNSKQPIEDVGPRASNEPVLGAEIALATKLPEEPTVLDVHPPHGGIHNWRDFLIHIATITIGLLIALGLEAGVEATHHHHIVVEARENIRREITQNRAEATVNLDFLQQNADNMQRNIAKARILRDHSRPPQDDKWLFQFRWSSFNESAWRGAQTSGALTYMPIDEVQSYADIYNQQEIVNQQAVMIFTHQSEIAAPLIMEPEQAQLRPEEVQALLTDSALNYMRLQTLQQLIQALAEGYSKTLSN